MFPIAHAAAPLLLLSIYNKIRVAKKQPAIPTVYYVIIGIAGVLPDIIGLHFTAAGRATFSHTIFYPLILLTAYVIMQKLKPRLATPVLLLLIGAMMHLAQDAIVGPLYPLHPFNMYEMNIWFIPRNDMLPVYWYLFDAFFFGWFVIVEKTKVVESLVKARLQSGKKIS
jgi:hypothetical protein